MGDQLLVLHVPDMSCGHCVSAVTKAIKEQDPEAKVTVSLSDKRVSVETTESRDTIADCLAEAGYPVVQSS